MLPHDYTQICLSSDVMIIVNKLISNKFKNLILDYLQGEQNTALRKKLDKRTFNGSGIILFLQL
jgi:hypothetical protein